MNKYEFATDENGNEVFIGRSRTVVRLTPDGQPKMMKELNVRMTGEGSGDLFYFKIKAGEGLRMKSLFSRFDVKTDSKLIQHYRKLGLGDHVSFEVFKLHLCQYFKEIDNVHREKQKRDFD